MQHSNLQVSQGQVHDRLPALTNPQMASGAPGTEVFRDEDRVVGIVLGDEAMEIPLDIIW